MGFIETARDMLVAGTNGREVINYLRTEFTRPEQAKGTERSLTSLHSCMTKVRAAVVESGHAPESMETFKLSRKEVVSLKQAQEAARLVKSDHVLVIPEFAKLLRTVEALLDSAQPTDSNARLVIPLLIASGRRLTEICSPRSIFTATEHPRACRFCGQLKRKDAAGGSYVIPLLVPFATFAKGLAAFRSKQFSFTNDKRRAKTNVVLLTNAQVRTRYNFPLQVALEANRVVTLPRCHIHDLRALYASAVWLLYTSDCAFNRVLMKVLGHCALQDSLSYIHCRLEDIESLQHAFGQLPDTDPQA